MTHDRGHNQGGIRLQQSLWTGKDLLFVVLRFLLSAVMIGRMLEVLCNAHKHRLQHRQRLIINSSQLSVQPCLLSSHDRVIQQCVCPSA